MCGEGLVVARDILYAATVAVSLRLRGTCLMSLEEFVPSTPLTSLLKHDCGIHSIDEDYI